MIEKGKKLVCADIECGHVEDNTEDIREMATNNIPIIYHGPFRLSLQVISQTAIRLATPVFIKLAANIKHKSKYQEVALPMEA